MEVGDHHGSLSLLKVPGAILVGNQGVPHRNRFSPCWHALSVLELANLATSHSFAFVVFVKSYFTGMAAFTSTISVPAAQLAETPQLEPAFEHLLRNSSVHESVISTLRVNAITDRDTFVNVFDSEAALKEGASDLGFDLTSGGLPHKREFARVVTSWKTANVMSETKLQTDAVARAHGVPVTLLPCDWTSLVTEFKNKHGKHIPEEKLPAQSMSENFSERLADGTLKAEPLSHVVSLFEEEQQDSKRPDPTRQYNLQLDSKLTITTKRRHLSTEPTDEKGLRLKYSILTNLWLLAQMRQPGRTIYADFDRNTFVDFLETLLDKDNFNFYKEVDGRPMISPSWSCCLSYEFELRKEAIRLCKEQSFGIQSALWTTLRNMEHRMKHWLQLVAIPNAPSSSSSQELQSLKKRISDLEKTRSRSPRRNNQKQLSLSGGPQMLALPAPSAPAQKGGKGKDRRVTNRRGGAGRALGKGQVSKDETQASKDFDYLMRLSHEFRSNFHEKFHKNEVCYKFQRKTCKRTDGTCKFSHVCVGCGGSKPYNDCKCLTTKLP